MTTIKLKNGSGAPTSGDLAQGEPALDLTNKRLYTEDSGGTVIEVGTNPTSITTGTVTANGLTLGSEGDQISIPTSAGFSGVITTGDTIFGNAFEFKNGNGIVLVSDTNDSGATGGVDATLIARGSSATKTALFDVNGDISFYEDTGTTAKFFWDASAERLGIGNSSPTTALDVTGTVTADGLTVDGEGRIEETGAAARLTIARTDAANNAASASLDLMENNAANLHFGDVASFGYRLEVDGSTNKFNIISGNQTVTKKRFSIDRDTGDISFYEDTGTTAKLLWDASAESLSITGNANVWTIDNTTIYGNRAGGSIYVGNSDATGEFGITSGGSVAMQFDSSGNVGIGTSSPSASLEVDGVTNSTYLIVGGDDSSNGRALTFTSSASASFNGAVHTINAPSSQGVIALATGGSEAMRIDSSGALGLGTTPPSTSTHSQMFIGNESVILGSSSGALDIGNNLYYNSGWKYRTTGAVTLQDFSASGNIVFYRAASGTANTDVTLEESMRIDPNGNVGIGMT
jgi:hypothetical protein